MGKFGHHDPQFSNVKRGPPAGSGEHSKTVVYVKQKKIQGKHKGMHAHGRIGSQGKKFKQFWNKEWAATSKKAQKRGCR